MPFTPSKSEQAIRARVEAYRQSVRLPGGKPKIGSYDGKGDGGGAPSDPALLQRQTSARLSALGFEYVRTVVSLPFYHHNTRCFGRTLPPRSSRHTFGSSHPPSPPLPLLSLPLFLPISIRLYLPTTYEHNITATSYSNPSRSARASVYPFRLIFLFFSSFEIFASKVLWRTSWKAGGFHKGAPGILDT